MKSLRLALTAASFLLLGWLSVGCGHAQVKPTSFQVSLSWTAPAASGGWAGCTTASPCSYVASRITLASGVTACPAANVSTPNYTPLNTASPSTSASFNDTTAVGLNVCYVVQTEQGTAVSQPSNVAGPFVVPASPLAPSLTGNQTTAEVKPFVAPSGTADAPVLSARLVQAGR